MRIVIIEIIIFLKLVLLSAGIYGQDVNATDGNETQKRDLDYYFAFTEATKYSLIGNIEQAINLYKECLKYRPRSAAVNFQLSKIYLKIGELNLARSYGKLAHEIEKENKWYSLGLANIYQIEQKYDSAILIYEDLLKIKSEDINIYLVISSLYAGSEKYDMALEYLNIVEKKIGISKEVALSKFRIYRSIKKDDLARQQIHLALSLDDEDYSVIGMMAEYFRAINMPDSALFYYEMLIHDHKNDPSVAFSYNEFLIERNMIDSAMNDLISIVKDINIDNEIKANYFYRVIQNKQLLDRSKPMIDTVISEFLRSNIDDVKTMAVYSDIEFRIGNYLKASKILRKIIERDYNNYFAWEQLLFCENFLGQSDSIVKYGSLAVEIFPDRPVAYLILGSAYYGLKIFNEAIKKLEAGLEYCENDNIRFEFYALLAECYVELKSNEKSDYYFKKALVIDYYNINIRNNYAYYLAVRNERLKEAKKLSKYTILKEPKNSTYLDTYAWIMYKSNKMRAAYKYIVLAVKYAEEENSEILIHYGDILYERGKYQEALKYWGKAIDLLKNVISDELNDRILKVKKRIKK